MINQDDAVRGLDADRKRELLERLLRERFERELSFGERGLWFHAALAPASSSYNLLYVGRRHGELELPRLEAALRGLVRRHDLLGTTFRRTGERVVAVRDPNTLPPIRIVEAGDWPQQRVDELLDDLLEAPIELAAGPLWRLTLLRRGPAEHLLALTIPHIVVDFWSLDLVLAELSELYRDPDAELPALPARYADHVQWQRELVGSARGAELWAYWERQLAGDLPRLDLPGRGPRPATQTFAGATNYFDLGADRTRAARELARAHGVTLQVVVLSAYIALLHRYSGVDDIIVGSPIAGRGMPGAENIVGYFVNSVALRSDLGDNPAFATLLERTRRTVLDAVAHQDLPFTELAQRLVPVRDPAYPPIFQVFFAWESTRMSQATGGPAQLFEPVALRQGGAPVDLMLMVAEHGDTLSAVLQYNRDLFDPEVIARMAGHLGEILTGAAVDPHRPVGALPLLTAAELRQRAAWNDTAAPELRDRLLPGLIRDQADRTPAAVAVSFRDRDLTYRELLDRAQRLGGRLLEAGARPGGVVGIAVERSEMSVVSVLAVLLVGCAFLPVDPAHPAQRLRGISAEAGPAAWITDRRIRYRLPGDVPAVCVDDPDPAGPAPELPAVAITPDDVAYILFTSGTTGRPKGALNTHRGIGNRLLWMQRAYPLRPDDVVLHKTPANFDVSVWELFWALLAGARIVVAEPERHRDSGYLVRTIVEKGVTVTHFVPSMLRMFLADPEVRRCTGLREVITSGEALTADLRDEFFAALPARLHNLYGPTEAAIDVTYFDVDRADHGRSVPIGRPIANTAIHVVDRYLNPVPVGVAGELYIGGDGVGRGYLNRPELTAERFVDAGAPSDPARPGGMLYRTGDLARYRPDGEIEYLGRTDNQVKIRGVRIELGEIEGALTGHAQVREAAVVVRDDHRGEPRLVAYLVAAAPAAAPSTADLRAHLRNILPDAMIPAQFVPVEAIPTTPTGKRDTRALPDPDSRRPEISAGYEAPRTASQQVLCELWQQVLGIDTVGIADDFFELGGASTQTMDICTRATAAGIPLTPELMFRHRTVAALADAVDVTETTGTAAPVRPEVTADLPAPKPLAPKEIEPGNTIIESLGVYLPETVVTTGEVLAGCERPVQIPLEQLTGIRTRRVVADGEFTTDLAVRAAQRCLDASSYPPDSIDLLICTNISNTEGPDRRLVSEPGTSQRVRARLGLTGAIGFDISNACAGLFTGIAVADRLLRAGRVRNALVVSGEYVSHIIDTAQREIVDFLDDRLACLTVGDAGAAVILERAATPGIGFHDIELRTLSRYSELCIGKRTGEAHGGAIMHTQAVEQTALAVRKSVPFALRLLDRHGWQPEAVDRIVVHQTSQASIQDAMTTINQLIGRTAAHPANTVSNLEHRGNTASTTHMVAIHDLVEKGDVQSGDRILFGITGSGQTIGAALYTFDDLPDRLRGVVETRAAADRPPLPVPAAPTVRIAGVAVARPDGEDKAVDLAVRAGRELVTGAAAPGLVLYTGVFRDDYIVEPATATFVADRLAINHDPDDPLTGGTLAFDLSDSGTGFLKACYAATAMIETGATATALVVAAEADPDVPSTLRKRRGIEHLGSAALLTASAGADTGFGLFHFASHPEHLDRLTTFTRMHGADGLEVRQQPGLEEIYLDTVHEAIAALLRTADRGVGELDVVLAPQISSDFLTALAARLDIPRDRVVDVVDEVGTGGDLYTSSIPAALRHCFDTGRTRTGDLGLIVAAGAGVQVGCALYHF